MYAAARSRGIEGTNLFDAADFTDEGILAPANGLNDHRRTWCEMNFYRRLSPFFYDYV